MENESVVTTTPFDRIYLAAGCPNTTEIVMRSLGRTMVSPMADNAVYVFPILYLGERQPDPDASYLSLTNLIVGLLPRTDTVPFAQVQVYPNFDYMWRYNLPSSLWPLAKPLIEWSRTRLLWGRLYMHGDLSQSYRMSLTPAGPRFEYARDADTAAAKAAMASVRAALDNTGFYVPKGALIRQKSNTHYAATLPYADANSGIGPDAQIATGIFVCDSSVFPNLPAVSLTFTIMANAHRIATESL
jgi:hypothetical protein